MLVRSFYCKLWTSSRYSDIAKFEYIFTRREFRNLLKKLHMKIKFAFPKAVL